jgi:uncharacterized protein (DUF2267 family)
MTAVGLESIGDTVQLTHAWINELDALVGWESKARSYRLLRAVIQALRDWLPVNDAAHLGAQLPMLLRGTYYEHWRPATTPVSNRHRDDFLARVDEAFRSDPILFTSEAVSAVFELLTDKIGSGEIDKVRHSLPADLRALWPASSKAA